MPGAGLHPLWPASCNPAVASGNGPAAAVTCGSRLVAASSAGEAAAESTVAATCAPRCAANAWSNGALESTARARPSTEALVDTSSTTKITAACTRRRVSPPRIARSTGPGLIAAPARRRAAGVLLMRPSASSMPAPRKPAARPGRG